MLAESISVEQAKLKSLPYTHSMSLAGSGKRTRDSHFLKMYFHQCFFSSVIDTQLVNSDNPIRERNMQIYDAHKVYFGEEVGGVRGRFKQKMAADKDTNENTPNKLSNNI